MRDFRIAIVGTGGVGGYFAAALARSGTWVGLIVLGAQLDAIRRSGLQIQSPEGGFTVAPSLATSNPNQIGPVNAVIIAVKAWQLPEAAILVKPLLAPASRILPVQNGVEAPSILRESIRREHVLDGVCRIVSEVVGPGSIRWGGVQPSVHFGEVDGGELSATSQALRGALTAAGVVVHTPADMQAAIWEKLHFSAPVSAVAAAACAAVGDIRRNPATRELVNRGMREVTAVAEAGGIQLPADAIARSVEMFERLPDGTTVSMQRDIASMRPSELDAIVGVVVRLGRQHGVPTPAMETLHATLLAQEQRARADRSKEALGFRSGNAEN